MQFLTILAGYLAVVAASPFPEPTGDVQKRTSCSTKDNLAYKIIKLQGSKGEIFCYDYLHLPTITEYKELPETTSTVTVKKTIYQDCPHYAREAEAEPGDGDVLAKRLLLSGLTNIGGDLISKGCNCLNLHPKTITKTTYHETHYETKTYGKTTVCKTPEATPY